MSLPESSNQKTRSAVVRVVVFQIEKLGRILKVTASKLSQVEHKDNQ